MTATGGRPAHAAKQDMTPRTPLRVLPITPRTRVLTLARLRPARPEERRRVHAAPSQAARVVRPIRLA